MTISARPGVMKYHQVCSDKFKEPEKSNSEVRLPGSFFAGGKKRYSERNYSFAETFIGSVLPATGR